MTELISRDEVIKAINDLCMDAGACAERIWSTDAIDAIKKITAVFYVVQTNRKACVIIDKEKMDDMED